ncbi:MAG: hypothetical protein IJX76_04680 [Clostridia bacterium]|nr:hypothetical protein [Clostridia bacterium]
MSNRKKDEVHADDLLDQLKKHVAPPVIQPERSKSDEADDEPDVAQRPKTLEELFGHSFISRGTNSETRAVTKARPIPPERRENAPGPADPTKARIDETEYDLQAIFGMKEEAPDVAGASASARRKPVQEKPADPYDDLSIDEKKQIAADYRKKLWKMRGGILLLLLLSVFALIWENADAIGFGLPDFLNQARFPAVSGWIAIQLAVLGAVLVPEVFNVGKKDGRNVAPIGLFAVMLVVHTAYVVIRMLLVSDEPMLTFCLPVLSSGVLAKLCSYGAIKREYLAFAIAFSSKEKYTLRLLEGADANLERSALRDHMPEETRYFAVERVRSVLGFKREMRARSSVKRPVKLLTVLALLVGVGFGMMFWSSTKSLNTALSVGVGGFFLAMPLSLLYVFYAPLTTLSTGARRNNAAVMGERALDEYAPPSVVTFQDSEVFPPEQVQLVGVKVFGEADLSKVIGYASAIFCATGGSLGEMFSLVVSDTGYTADMDFITVSENGVEAAVDGELVLVGSRSFLREAGIKVPSDDRDLASDTAVMYMAISREAVARLEVSYEMDEDFEGIAQNLFRSGVCVAIKTFDPNINRAFMEKRIRWSSDMPLTVIRGKEKKDRILRREAAESILLSRTQRGLFETVKFCRTTRHLIQIGVGLAVLSLLAAVPIYWLILKMVGTGQVTSLNLMIYQLIWLLPTLVITKFFG